MRASFGLVMLDIAEFTRDIDLCVDCFVKKYSHKVEKMNEAKAFISTPTGNKDELINFLEDFGKWVIDESNLWLDKHNFQREIALPYKDE